MIKMGKWYVWIECFLDWGDLLIFGLFHSPHWFGFFPWWNDSCEPGTHWQIPLGVVRLHVEDGKEWGGDK